MRALLLSATLLTISPGAPAHAAPLVRVPAPRAAPARQDDDEAARRVARAVEELERAFEKGEPEDRFRAVQAHATVDDPAVIAWFAKGLRDASKDVRGACLDALRDLRHPAALKTLRDAYRRDKDLRRDEELGVRLIQAIARHGDPATIELLADDVFDARAPAIVRARILGLGWIRDPRSVEALIGIVKKTSRQRSAPFLDDYRLALLVLTGVDRGRSQDAWLEWWNENKKSLAVGPELPPLPRADRARWIAYWGLPREYGRPTPREERGDDRRRRE